MMKYAPVVIPTLNRKEHLRILLESLQKNVSADKTDLIISVDYPPSDRYREGYEEVKKYLADNEDLRSHFKSVQIFYQSENLGPYRNAQFLYDHAQKLSERCIFTEDDNEFAPNFLEYINQCLEIFEDDERVIGVCARKEMQWNAPANDTVIAAKLYSAYGTGIWFKKKRLMQKEIPTCLFSPDNTSLKALLALRRRNSTLFNKYVNAVLLGHKRPFWNGDDLAIIDTTSSIYMYLTDHFCVVPAISKSQTHGNDGSGVNMKKTDNTKAEAELPLDTSANFKIVIQGRTIDTPKDYRQEDFIYDVGNEVLAEHYMRTATSWKEDVKALIGLVRLMMVKKTKTFKRQ